MRMKHNYRVIVKVKGLIQEVLVNAINPNHARSQVQYTHYAHTEIKIISVLLVV